MFTFSFFFWIFFFRFSFSFRRFDSGAICDRCIRRRTGVLRCGGDPLRSAIPIHNLDWFSYHDFYIRKIFYQFLLLMVNLIQRIMHLIILLDFSVYEYHRFSEILISNIVRFGLNFILFFILFITVFVNLAQLITLPRRLLHMIF